MEKEVWKDVEGSEGIYQVSNIGNVRSLDRVTVASNGKRCPIKGKDLIKIYLPTGYLRVFTQNRKPRFIHRLVAAAFIPNPENKPFVNHIDGNKQNNRVENLEWCTHKENIQHALRIGAFNYKIKKEDILKIRALPKKNYKGIAEKFGIGLRTVNSIKNNESWKNV